MALSSMIGRYQQIVLPKFRKSDIALLALVEILTTAIFILDLFVPLGFAVLMLYFFPVWLTLRPRWQRFSLFQASLSTLLMFAGFFLSPEGPVTIALVNHALGVATLWGIVVLGFRRQQAEEAFLIAHNELERRAREAMTDSMQTNEELQRQTRKRVGAEEALRESREQFASAFQDAAIGMALVRTDGQWLQVNRALCEIVGYTEQEMLTMNFQVITHPDDLETDLAYAKQLLAGEISTYQMDKRYFHKLGNLVWIQLNVSLVRDSAGQASHFIAQIQNITDRNRVLEKLHESEARLQAILNNSPTLIFLKDIEGRYLLVNQEFEKVLHLTPGVIVGKTDSEMFSPVQATAFRANDLKVIQADAPLQFEEIAFHADGPHTSIVLKFPLRDESGKVYAIGGIATDITDREQAEQALRASEKELRRVLEEREQLSLNLHDNIIQTICAVGMELEECQYIIQESPATAMKHLAHAIAELNVVIQQVRSCLVAQYAEIPPCAEYLEEELTRLTQMVENTKGLHFRSNVEALAIGSLSPKVAQQIMSIAREAVSNSIRHSGASTVSLSLRVNGASLRLSIEDDGAGFGSESRRSQGHGMRNIAARTQQIRGTLQVISQPGHGAHIVIDFPREQSNVLS